MAVPSAPAASKAAEQHKTQTVGANPFTRAARRKTEVFLDRSTKLRASSSNLDQIEVPATGFLRHLWLYFTVTVPEGTTGVHADAPWNIIESIAFRDVNGQPLHTLSGFDLYLSNLIGGYTQNADPKGHPAYKVTGMNTAGTAITFALRVPIEIISRGALGALSNTNASMLYKLAVTLAPRAVPFTGATADADVRIRGVVESWSNPNPTDLRGTPNITQPPALGTTQNWSEYVSPVTVGQNTIRFPRVGNSIRNLVLILRDAQGQRITDDAASWPDTLSIYLDGNLWHQCPSSYLRERAHELFGFAIPSGVIVLPFTDDFDGTPGEEVGDFWVETSGATRLELQASFGAPGSITVLTNDVLAVAGHAGAGQTLGA